MNKLNMIPTMLILAVLISVSSMEETANAASSSELPTHVNVGGTADVLSISIAETSLDFGNLKIGQSNSANIHISNDGSVNVRVDVNPSDMTGAKGAIIRKNNFDLFPRPPLFIFVGGGVLAETVTLNIPRSTEAGEYFGTIDITASEINTQHF